MRRHAETGEGEVEAGETATSPSPSPALPTGAPITDLEPYLAAAGHVVVMAADTSSFAHEHAEVEAARGRPVFALHYLRHDPPIAASRRQ